MKKIAAVVTLYNPDLSVYENIITYANQVKVVYAVDNSDSEISDSILEKIKSIQNLIYISESKNLGIAKSLNIGANFAMKANFDYLLTMDQDSKASEKMVNILLSVMSSHHKIAIAAAEHFNPSFHHISGEFYCKDVLYTMSSGNLLDLSIYNIVGGFKDELFIDYVDHEYCLRLNKLGYRVIITNDTLVFHTLGKSEKKKILGVNLYPTHHSPLRYYYRTRNRYYVNKLYISHFPKYVREDHKNQLREFIYLLFGEKQVLKKIKLILLGYLDYRRNKLGKYESD
ncbi:MAG: glycosyltransferase [Ignavibacterium sp.]|jgi:rhamnosyltransferase|nr:glycosyltransferase [Ignavibacterium sp.]